MAEVVSIRTSGRADGSSMTLGSRAAVCLLSQTYTKVRVHAALSGQLKVGSVCRIQARSKARFS